MRHQYATALQLILAATTYAFQPQTLHERAPSYPEPIRGVNLGGWFVTEQWITPSVYRSTSADDEWSLCNDFGPKRCLSTLQQHWRTFYTRPDFVAIKAAGLNAVRIPLGYWAVDILPYEPYVSGQYPYLIQAVQWARELGLSVLIDLHGAPGSQNGQDNSGLIGPVLFASNSSNADRSLNVLRNLTEEFSRGVYGGVVTAIELLNEPRLSNNITGSFSMDQLKQFYADGTEAVRGADTNTFNVTIHDAFWGPQYWAGYNPSSNTSVAQTPNYLTTDTHQYYAFAPLNNLSRDGILESICNISQLLKTTTTGIPQTVVGEWSLETESTDPSSSSDDDQATRTWYRLLFESQLAAYSPRGPGQPSLGWFFWTWKTEYDIDTWSYRRGIAEEYIPADVSNASMLVFPVLENGCVDASFNYTAPKYVGAAGARSNGGMALWWLPVVLVAALVNWGG